MGQGCKPWRTMSQGDTRDLAAELEAELRPGLSAGPAAVIKQTINRPRAPLPAQFGTRHGRFKSNFVLKKRQGCKS
jgi:hypothetical protein